MTGRQLAIEDDRTSNVKSAPIMPKYNQELTLKHEFPKTDRSCLSIITNIAQNGL